MWHGSPIATFGVFREVLILMVEAGGAGSAIDRWTKKGPESVSRGYGVRTLEAVALGNLRPPLTPN